MMDKYHIDGHKLYWHLDRVVGWQKNRIIPPVYIEISPVSMCNHKCTFCGIDFIRDDGVYLDSHILQQRLSEMGKLGVRSIMFAGEGEPMLHKGLPLLLRTAHDSGIDVSMTTNGSMGSYSVWKEILPCLTWLRFSVDAGTADVYSKVHNVPQSSFYRTMRSIEEAIQVKKDNNLETTIGVQFLMVNENMDSLEEAICLFSKIGVDYFSIKPFSMHPQMINKKEMIYTDDTMRVIGQIVSRYREDSKMRIIFRGESMGKYTDKNLLFNHCYALPFWGYISSKGDFYTCSVFINDERFKTGNIYEEDMEHILFGEKRQSSITYAERDMKIADECRLNCRMARVNEFLEFLNNEPEHVNFI